MRIGYHTITWGGVTGAPAGVTSVKDLYYRSHGSLEKAVNDIAEVGGYEGVEVFDGNLTDYAARPATLLDLLEARELNLASVYTGANFIYEEILDDELHRVHRAAELASMFRAEWLVVGGGALRAAGVRDEDYSRLAAALDRVVGIAEGYDLGCCYHPHLGSLGESPADIDRLMTATRIGFCPDTAHLAAGGGDPAALIRAYPDRIRHVHYKDLDQDTGVFQPLGQGDLNFQDVTTALHEVNFDSWLIVELDHYDGDPREAAERSKAYLDKLFA